MNCLFYDKNEQFAVVDFCMELAQLLSRRRWEKCAFCRGAAGKSAHVVEMLLLDTFRRFTSKNTTFWPNFAASARQKCYDPEIHFHYARILV